MLIRCQQTPVLAGSASLAALGALVLYLAEPSGYGKHSESPIRKASRLPARAAWFLQELPSFVVPAAILALQPCSLFGPPGTVLLGLFCAHYFHRTFIYSLLTRGRPFPVTFIFRGFVFCFGNGFLQGYYLIYCAEYPDDWYTDVRFSLGVFLFIVGMGINIHSDYILRQLRKPGEVNYRIPQDTVLGAEIPEVLFKLNYFGWIENEAIEADFTSFNQGGLFTYVSGANFLGEIVEWIGYALASWSFPALAFAFFSLCFLGLRAFHHHRFYLKMFEDYPKSRKALIPYIF